MIPNSVIGCIEADLFGDYYGCAHQYIMVRENVETVMSLVHDRGGNKYDDLFNRTKEYIEYKVAR